MINESQHEKIARLETDLTAACERWRAALDGYTELLGVRDEWKEKCNALESEVNMLQVRNRSIIGKLSQDRADALAERDALQVELDNHKKYVGESIAEGVDEAVADADVWESDIARAANALLEECAGIDDDSYTAEQMLDAVREELCEIGAERDQWRAKFEALEAQT